LLACIREKNKDSTAAHQAQGCVKLVGQGGASMSEHELENVREKRTSRRIRSLNLTSYTPKKGDRQEYIVSIGRTLDVSEGGVKVETHRALANGTELEMDIAIEDRIITAKGEVVHTEELKNGLFGTGIRFTSISEEDRISLR
jgi:hypothetical protein